MPEAEVFGIDAGGEKERGMYPAREVVVKALPVVFNPDFPLARIERVDWREFGGQVE